MTQIQQVSMYNEYLSHAYKFPTFSNPQYEQSYKYQRSNLPFYTKTQETGFLDWGAASSSMQSAQVVRKVVMELAARGGITGRH